MVYRPNQQPQGVQAMQPFGNYNMPQSYMGQSGFPTAGFGYPNWSDLISPGTNPNNPLLWESLSQSGTSQHNPLNWGQLDVAQQGNLMNLYGDVLGSVLGAQAASTNPQNPLNWYNAGMPLMQADRMGQYDLAGTLVNAGMGRDVAWLNNIPNAIVGQGANAANVLGSMWGAYGDVTPAQIQADLARELAPMEYSSAYQQAYLPSLANVLSSVAGSQAQIGAAEQAKLGTLGAAGMGLQGQLAGYGSQERQLGEQLAAEQSMLGQSLGSHERIAGMQSGTDLMSALYAALANAYGSSEAARATIESSGLMAGGQVGAAREAAEANRYGSDVERAIAEGGYQNQLDMLTRQLAAEQGMQTEALASGERVAQTQQQGVLGSALTNALASLGGVQATAGASMYGSDVDRAIATASLASAERQQQAEQMAKSGWLAAFLQMAGPLLAQPRGFGPLTMTANTGGGFTVQ